VTTLVAKKIRRWTYDGRLWLRDNGHSATHKRI
jgi:hypothetical protein